VLHDDANQSNFALRVPQDRPIYFSKKTLQTTPILKNKYNTKFDGNKEK
jgi:hypothetical protein